MKVKCVNEWRAPRMPPGILEYKKQCIHLWRRQWHPTPVLLPGKSHGRRILEGCSPWGRWESDTTERLHFHFFSCIGEGNGNPLQCSCLENPGDRGAWWAAVYGVTQSRTRLKRLSSSSSSSDNGSYFQPQVSSGIVLWSSLCFSPWPLVIFNMPVLVSPLLNVQRKCRASVWVLSSVNAALSIPSTVRTISET